VPDEIEIRPLNQTEHLAVGEATARAFREFWTPGSSGWEPYLARIADVENRAERGIVLVATDDGVIAGSVTLELDERISPGQAEPLAPDEAHIRMLGVTPEYRGRGIARRLVLECIGLARAHGKRVMTLDTDPLMIAAQQLYAGLGFEPSAPQVRPDGLALLSYTLVLDSDGPANR
jgi:ribosomal protein S18 acetylase RimI-like enzyme